MLHITVIANKKAKYYGGAAREDGEKINCKRMDGVVEKTAEKTMMYYS